MSQIKFETELRTKLKAMSLKELETRMEELEEMPETRTFKLTQSQVDDIKTHFVDVLENTVKGFQLAGVTLAFYQNFIDAKNVTTINWGNVKFIQTILQAAGHKTKKEAADIYTTLKTMENVNVEVANLEKELYHASEIFHVKETAENEGIASKDYDHDAAPDDAESEEKSSDDKK